MDDSWLYVSADPFSIDVRCYVGENAYASATGDRGAATPTFPVYEKGAASTNYCRRSNSLVLVSETVITLARCAVLRSVSHSYCMAEPAISGLLARTQSVQFRSTTDFTGT
jgi:hypothetical protein